jgi:uncharacterized membrane protein
MKFYSDLPRKHWAGICLLIITIAGLALRLYHLDYQGYFSEEVFTLNGNSLSYYQMILDSFINPQSGEPPLYFFIDKLSTGLFGSISLLSIRFPSAIFGTLCIPAIYALGEEYRDKITGLLAALTITLSERTVFYSQYARPYTLIFLLFILATYCFLKLQKGAPFQKWMLALTLITGLCLLTHYYSIIPLSIFWAVLIYQNRAKILPYATIAIIPSILFILYTRALIWSLLINPFRMIHETSVFKVTWIDILIRVPYECWGYLALILIPLFVLYLWFERDKITVYFGLVAGMTYATTILLTFVFDPSARYAVLIAPLIIIPALVPVSQFIGKKRTTQRVILFAGAGYLILIANVFPLIAWYTTAYHFVFI